MTMLLESRPTVDSYPALEDLEFTFPVEEPAYHPSQDDVEFINLPVGPSDADIEEAYQHCRWMDRLEALHAGDDERDLFLMGHPVG